MDIPFEGVVGGEESREKEVCEDKGGEGSYDEEETGGGLDDGADRRVEGSEGHGEW